MKYKYYKIIISDTDDYMSNIIIWDYDRLIETIDRLERENRKFEVQIITERSVYNA